MKFKILMYLLSLSLLSCNAQKKGPGYTFDLFKGTAVWKLAKAVEEEDQEQIKQLVNLDRKIIDYQEPKLKRTLLMLAIGNNKLYAVKTLLEEGANVNIRDIQGDEAIHEVTKFPNLSSHSFEMLKLLLKYGADANAISYKVIDGKTYFHSIPLMGAIKNFDCAKLLLDKGANPYFRNQNEPKEFVVWDNLLLNFYEENIYVAKYMIIDKKMSIPNPFSYNVRKEPNDIFHFLKTSHVQSLDFIKKKTIKDLLNYLHDIDFPKHQVYKDSTFLINEN